MQLHAEARVGTVVAEALHGLGILHALQREFMLDAHGLKHLGHDAFHHVDDVVAVHEAHLDVHLGELGLTVGAQVLVAEAPGNLVVALDAGHHEHLLELLRALRQRVEAARVRTAGHDVVARAFGRGVRQDGGFHLQEAALVERAAHGLGNRVAQVQGLVHLRTADVQVAPLHARGLVRLDAVLDGERRGHGRVEHLDGAGQHLDLARGHVRVHGVRAALSHLAGHLEHVLTTQVLGLREVLGRDAVGVDDHLRVALAVAQVHEDEPAVVAVMPRPARQHDLAAHVFLAQLAARGSMHAVFVLEIGHQLVPCSLQCGMFACRPRGHATREQVVAQTCSLYLQKPES